MQIWSGRRIKRKDKVETAGHVHPWVQVFFIKSGFMNLSTDARSFFIAPGQMIWIPPRCWHRTTTIGETSGWSVYLPSNSRVFFDVTALNATELLNSLFERMSQYGHLGNSARDRSMKTLVLEEMKSLSEASMGLPFPQSPNLRAVAETIYIQTISLSTKSAAQKAAMSERNFSRRFRAETGLTFEKWRRRVLNEVAIKLLLTGKSVSQVADETGFQTVSAFIASFKQQFGRSPLKMIAKFSSAPGEE
jgi:AraC-like DNA-binding protein